MKIAIIGLGVAGSYLLNTLSDEHDVTGYEMQKEGGFDAICAWGASKNEMTKILSNIDFDFNKYIFFTGKEINLELKGKLRKVPCKGLVTYDKHGLELDLCRKKNAKYGVRVTPNDFPFDKYDLVIDATSLQRIMLPKINEQLLVPCVEYKVEYDKIPFDDFYVRPFDTNSGYLWFFPLQNNIGHIGAGDYHRKHNEALESFMEKYKGKIIKKVGRPIRLSAPQLCKPFSKGNVVGVGEAIGTVFPLMGEGIIPSLHCAEMLKENLNDIETYEQRVLEKFSSYTDIYKIIKLKMDDKISVFSMLKYSGILWNLYRTMKSEEERFGLEVRMRDLMAIMLSQRGN